MKRILLLIALFLNFSLIANADNIRRSCDVYQSPYKVTIVHGYTMIQGGEYGTYVCIDANCIDTNYKNLNGDKITVYVNALDRTTGCIVDTVKVEIYIARGKTSGRGDAYFKNLNTGVYYNVSIDSASCN